MQYEQKLLHPYMMLTHARTPPSRTMGRSSACLLYTSHLARDAPRRGGRGNERRLLDLGLFLLRGGKHRDGGRFRLGLCRSLRRRSDDWAGHDLSLIHI